MSVDVIVEDERWRESLPQAETLAARCFEAAREKEPAVAGETALLLADDATLRDLNRRFRGKDKPTNVLSFPSGEAQGGGDIAIAFETCAREAQEKGVALEAHAAHLIVHGLLHLAGHDHEADDEAGRMEALEIRILDALGVCDPYSLEEQVD